MEHFNCNGQNVRPLTKPCTLRSGVHVCDRGESWYVMTVGGECGPICTSNKIDHEVLCN